MLSTSSQSLLELLSQVVQDFPDDKAVEEASGTYLTYRQLDHESTLLAHCLRRHGIQPGQIIPLLTSHCVHMVVGIVGILKVGAVYVPVDEERVSSDRWHFILEQTRASLAIQTGSNAPFDGVETVRLPLDQTNESDITCTSIDTSEHDCWEDLLCIIFTSGTTNKPKGVRVRQASVAKFVSSSPFNYDLRPRDRVLLALSVEFDACMGTLFNVICSGSTVVLADRYNFQTRAKECNVIVATPSMLQALASPKEESYPDVTKLVIGGETPSQKLLEAWSTLGVPVWIAYGPTEATCAVLTSQLIADPATGQYRPTWFDQVISGTTVLLMTENLMPIEETGQDGEICISGQCLSAGYLHNETLEKQRFVEYEESRLYRTGDVARWVNTGDGQKVLELRGRQDRTTKVRGFLVNLEQDVDQGLIQSDAAVEAVFSLMIDQQLCTAVVGSQLDTEKLISSWREKAPPFMVPDHIFQLDALPTTLNGKIDPRELARILEAKLSQYSQLTPHPTTHSLRDIITQGLCDILHCAPFRIDQSQSFIALGGHSLAAAKLSTYLRRHGYQIPAHDILLHSSLESLIAKYEQQRPETEQMISRDNVTSGVLSSLQSIMVLETLENSSANGIRYTSYYRTKDIAKLKAAWQKVASVEPLFRTVFRTSGTHLVQELEQDPAFLWDEVVASSYEEVNAHLEAVSKTTGLGTRFLVLHLTKDGRPMGESMLVWAVHHALIDGYSASLIFTKLDAALQDQPFQASIPYTQAAMDLCALQEAMADDIESFWKDQNNRYSAAAGDLLFSHACGPAETPRRKEHTIEFDISPEFVSRQARQLSITPATFFYAAWASLLSSYLNSTTVIFGAVLSGRNLPFSWASSVIGPLINTLPFQCQVNRSVNNSGFLQEMHGLMQELSRFQLSDRPSDVPRFTTVMTVQYAGLQEGTTALPPIRTPSVQNMTDAPLTVVVDMSLNQIRFLYQDDQFPSQTVQDIGVIYNNLLRALTIDSEDMLGTCLAQGLSSKMHQRLRRWGNHDLDSTHTSNEGHTLTSLWKGVVEANGTSIAVAKNSKTITYAELAFAATRVASMIQLLAEPGDVVAIFADRSINWIIGVWACMVANTVYCPVDASYPMAYQARLLQQSKAAVLLLPHQSSLQHADIAPITIAIDKVLQSSIRPVREPWRVQRSSDAAYLCFTSGSTGVPKGVLCEHRGVVAYHSALETRLHSEPGRRIAQVLSTAFDGAIHEIFATLCYGGTLVLRKDDRDMFSHIRDVDVATLSPSVAAELDPNEFPNLEYVYLVGEPVPQRLVDRWATTKRTLYNGYGPTETTIIVCQQKLRAGAPVNIGPPVPTARLYILNDHFELQPPGAIGHIFVAGTQVSRGYFNLPDLTASEFMLDPFVRGAGHERMYRTGDVGFWDEEGNVQLCGRIDRQVKSRGYRVNLDDVAHAAYQAMPSIRKAAATAEDTSIILFVEPADVNTHELQTRLRSTLAPHAVPRRIVALRSLPLTTNGKIDVKGLVAPESDSPQDKECQTTSELITAQWRQLLKLDSSTDISGSDDFVGLGGNSILQLKLAARIRSTFGIPISIQHIISSPTLKDMVGAVERQIGISSSQNNLSDAVESLTLTPTSASPTEISWIQRYIDSQCQSSFNVSYTASLPKSIDLRKMGNALETVLNRHHILRSRFTNLRGPIRREIAPELIRVAFTQALPLDQVINKPFSLTSEESLVTALIAPDCMVLTISHILCDLTALNTILDEVTQCYHGQSLGPVAREYFDVTIWNEPISEDNRTFWQEYLHGLDIHRSRTTQKRTYQGTWQILQVPDSTFQKLIAYSTKEGITLHQFSLAVTSLVLHVLCDREDVVIGSPYMNRPGIEDQGVVGLFLEPLPVRIARVPKNSSARTIDFLQYVRSAAQSALAHAIPWHQLMELFQLPFPSDRDEIFDCAVSFLDERDRSEHLAIDGVVSQDVWSQGAKFSVLFEWHASATGLFLRCEYETDRFSKEYISVLERMILESLEQLLEPNALLADVKEVLRQSLKHDCEELGLEVSQVCSIAREFMMGS
ncbi:acetyl-CoA synthetase-like protein [Aspergillus homomorphus CBS 101889]|uniref:Acetyl-CoA synthetase-like protein n=1 Tax=Aspergillus homomorphus (strain CBS 101889) TaxID=1450537 RepID=A0A395HP12_ASPHC|nr:acetyl-CoA synthetase-like protein [Aspergillus homomorphus CBS 101889]RAL08588.1 acetyl-CoA synthetase-like protein [Aspergillus homomorphus CBS 101889]